MLNLENNTLKENRLIKQSKLKSNMVNLINYI